MSWVVNHVTDKIHRVPSAIIGHTHFFSHAEKATKRALNVAKSCLLLLA